MRSISASLIPLGNLIDQPFFVGLCACSLCALALTFLASESKVASSGKVGRRLALNRLVNSSRGSKTLLNCATNSAVVTIVILAWTKSIIITIPFTMFSVVITWVYLRNKGRRATADLLQVWPEVTDHLISAIHSGLSLSEALVGLGTRGPERIRPYFLSFHQELLANGNFVSTTERLKGQLNSHGSDQILEAILLAKSLGGSELLHIFRTLGDFLRQDLALRKEIEIKHGWIKNSAHLSSAAPWLLLLLLSSQPGTAQAFAQPGGIAILAIGLVLTSVAYLWMGKLGQLPNPPRVFE
jgi:tight adherence protein B